MEKNQPSDDMWSPLASGSSSSDVLPKERKPIWLLGVAGLALVGLTGLGLTVGLKSDEPKEPRKITTVANSPDTVDPEETWYRVPTDTLPEDTPEWGSRQAPVSVLDLSEEEKEWALDTVRGTQLETLTTFTIPAEGGLYTNDPSQATDANGNPNPDYAYWLQEDLLRQSTLTAYRFLNPVYGQWVKYQHPEAKAGTTFKGQGFFDVLTDRYLKELSTRPSEFPILADWDANDYGMRGQLPGDGAVRWVGEIRDANVEYVYEKKTLGYRMKVTYDVEFTTLTEDRDKLERPGTLYLEFVPDPRGSESPTQWRVQVDKGSLTVGAVEE